MTPEEKAREILAQVLRGARREGYKQGWEDAVNQVLCGFLSQPPKWLRNRDEVERYLKGISEPLSASEPKEGE